MTDKDPIEERLGDAIRDLGRRHTPEVGDPEAVADQVLTRSVSSAGSTAGTATKLGGLKLFGVLAVVALAGIGTGIWAGSSGGKSPSATASGVVDLPTTQIWRCPDKGVIGTLTSGDRILLTGRTEDGLWARLRNPVDLESNVWVNTAAIEADQKIDDLPVVECDDPTANPDLLSEMAMGGAAVTTTVPASDDNGPDTTVPDTVVPDDSGSTTTPGPTTTAPELSPTTTRPGGPTTTTTQKPSDKTGPNVTNVAASPKDVWTQDHPSQPCPPDKSAKKVTVTARATDPSGVSSARFQWSVNGNSDNVNMTRSGSTWTGTATFPYETLPDHGDGMNQTVTVRLYATDGAGNVTQKTTSFTLHSSAQCLG